MASGAPQPGPRFERREAPGARCPNCAALGLSVFYGVDGIPVHSCLLMGTRGEALDYPRGGLSLGFCRACGFVCNTRFDPGVHEYSQRYEETQGFSPTFNAFARSLAQRYADQYPMAGKTVLEIGCGKGEFLALLCELSGASGIGIDPGYIPGRLTSPALPRLRFINDFYGPAYADLPADYICCRHTLEHIAPTGQFLRDLRATVGEREGTVLLFELPDAMRVLREGAFWDIYYEHCSYFTCGSLARVFRAAGFDVTLLELRYGGQYIILDAVPAGSGHSAPRLPLEDDLAETAGHVERFAETCGSVARRWADLVRGAHARGERTVIWGSGSKGVSFLTTLGLGLEVAAAVDINPHRHGRFMPGSGHEIVPPEELRSLRPDLVIVMNPVYVPEITAGLRELGIKARVEAL